jgi:hypothetical protein
MSPKQLRKRIFVDPAVQGALVSRMVLYWITCAITVVLAMLLWAVLTRPIDLLNGEGEQIWFHFGPVLLGSLMLLPLVILDMVRLSHRFVGPLVRLRRSMRALARGEEVEPIEFRDGDYWQDFAADFNALAARMKALQDAPEVCQPEEEPVGSSLG